MQGENRLAEHGIVDHFFRAPRVLSPFFWGHFLAFGFGLFLAIVFCVFSVAAVVFA